MNKLYDIECTVYTATIGNQNKEDTTASAFAFISFIEDATCFEPYTGHLQAYNVPI
jgi:hypothetical protein